MFAIIPEEEEYGSDDIKSPFELFPEFSSRGAQCEDIYSFGITEEAWKAEGIKLAWSIKNIPNDRLDFNVIILYDNYVNKLISIQNLVVNEHAPSTNLQVIGLYVIIISINKICQLCSSFSINFRRLDKLCLNMLLDTIIAILCQAKRADRAMHGLLYLVQHIEEQEFWMYLRENGSFVGVCMILS